MRGHQRLGGVEVLGVQRLELIQIQHPAGDGIVGHVGDGNFHMLMLVDAAKGVEDRTIKLFKVCRERGMGVVAFSPLAGGLLSDRYLAGIPADSRAASASPFLTADQITEEKLATVRALHALALQRGQSLSQLALQWVLRDPVVSCALIGASHPQQITSAVDALGQPPLDDDLQQKILSILA